MTSAHIILQLPILDEIRTVTGRSFVQVDSIDTRDKEIADLVLPVLLHWPHRLGDRNLRHAIYARFDTPHARKYLEEVVSWWLTERWELAVGTLTQIVSVLITASDAERVWEAYRNQPPKLFHYMLLAKLATLPSPISAEVKERIIRDLEHEEVPVGDLQYISQVDDPRINEWFERQMSSPDSRVRRIAAKKVKKRAKMPKGLILSAKPPDRIHELFSTEVDLEDVPGLLTDIERRMGFSLPGTIRRATFLSELNIDQWAVTTVLARERTFTVWFRLEGVDTVEIFVGSDKAIEVTPVQ